VRLVLLGDPVEHSLSPAIHNAAMAACGIEGSYEARAVDRAGLRAAIDEVRYGALRGANVTMPHKEAAFLDCERPSAEAMQAGAVNTLVADQGRVRGHNTDITGVREAWMEAELPEGAPVLLLGAGGAAAAAAIAVSGVDLHVASRRPDSGRALLARIRVAGKVVPWGKPVPSAVVVNATPLGMAGEELPAGLLDRAVGLFDMAYGSRSTPAVGEALTAGMPVATGPDMLLAQAIVSFELWTGRKAPRDVMAAVLQAAEQHPAAD
jgi:shikimate dehydrogenase